MNRWFSFFAVFFIAVSDTYAAELDPVVQACLEKNSAHSASLQTIELRSWDRIGSEKLTVADVYVKRFGETSARMLAYFREPEDIRGTRLLAIVEEGRNDMYVYIPILFKTRRITAKRLSTSVYGTDFSYEDLEWLYGLISGGEVRRIPDRVLDGHPSYVFQASMPADTSSGYEAVMSYIDQKSCVPRKFEFFERGARLRKVLSVDAEALLPVGDVLVPHGYVMQDLRDKTRTRLTVRDIQTDVQIADETLEPEKIKEFRGVR